MGPGRPGPGRARLARDCLGLAPGARVVTCGGGRDILTSYLLTYLLTYYLQYNTPNGDKSEG